MSEPLRADRPSKCARYRERKRAQGMKLLRIWVPDPNAPGFVDKVAREAERLRGAPEEQEVLDWIEAATADLDLPPYELPADEDGADESSSS